MHFTAGPRSPAVFFFSKGSGKDPSPRLFQERIKVPVMDDDKNSVSKVAGDLERPARNPAGTLEKPASRQGCR